MEKQNIKRKETKPGEQTENRTNLFSKKPYKRIAKTIRKMLKITRDRPGSSRSRVDNFPVPNFPVMYCSCMVYRKIKVGHMLCLASSETKGGLATRAASIHFYWAGPSSFLRINSFFLCFFICSFFITIIFWKHYKYIYFKT